MVERHAAQDREAARRDKQSAAETGAAAAGVVASARFRVLDREIVDRDGARIIEEAAIRVAAAERISAAVDDQRVAAREIDRGTTRW